MLFKHNKNAHLNNKEDLNQYVHPHCLIRVLVSPLKQCWTVGYTYMLGTDAQADPRLRWLHMPI